MDARLLDDLRREAAELGERAVHAIKQGDAGGDPQSVETLRRVALQTRLTTLLMDAVGCLALCDPYASGQCRLKLSTRVRADDWRQHGGGDPGLVNLFQSVLRFHARLERLQAQLSNGPGWSHRPDGARGAHAAARCDRLVRM